MQNVGAVLSLLIGGLFTLFGAGHLFIIGMKAVFGERAAILDWCLTGSLFTAGGKTGEELKAE